LLVSSYCGAKLRLKDASLKTTLAFLLDFLDVRILKRGSYEKHGGAVCELSPGHAEDRGILWHKAWSQRHREWRWCWRVAPEEIGVDHRERHEEEERMVVLR